MRPKVASAVRALQEGVQRVHFIDGRLAHSLLLEIFTDKGSEPRSSMAEVPALVSTSAAHLYDSYVLKNYARAPVTLVRGRGTTVWDDQGRAYLDFSSGIAVSSLGHCHPQWVAAVQRQAAELIHMSNLFRTPNQGELARRLVGYAGPGRVFFCNSGGEADEALIKLARLHGVRKSGASRASASRSSALRTASTAGSSAV